MYLVGFQCFVSYFVFCSPFGQEYGVRGAAGQYFGGDKNHSGMLLCYLLKTMCYEVIVKFSR